MNKLILSVFIAAVLTGIKINAQQPAKAMLFNIPPNFSNGIEYNWVNSKFILIDMTGDGKPDLLDAENENTNPDDDVFKNGMQPCWKVYTAIPGGFSANGILWPIPKNFANGVEYDLGNNEFMLIDMNGDKKPDLLDLENETTTSEEDVFLNGTQPFWRVYFNTGTGFKTEAIQWNIPGSFQNGFEYKSDSEQFRIIDMNGDGKPDLLDTENEKTNPENDTFKNGAQPAWKVYINTGSGFTPDN